MSKTKISHGSNMVWEGSRFILPEHSKALHIYGHEKNRKSRPVFDEQEIEELNYRIQEAILTQTHAKISVFGEFDNTNIYGVIQSVDQQRQQLRVKVDDSFEHIDLKDILDLCFRT